jgi:phage protein D
MEPTVLMSLEDKPTVWKERTDSAIASEIFEKGKYRIDKTQKSYGFEPVVKDTTWTYHENEASAVQQGTDIKFLKQLAFKNGFECYVELNPATGVLEGHFHPPRLDRAQGYLRINMGEATNVNSFRTRYNMLQPAETQTAGLDVESQTDQLAQAKEPILKSLGRESLMDRRPLRKIRLRRTGLFKTGELQNYAQAITDRSSWAIIAEGELNTVAYGGILRAKRPINVCGAGLQFSGTYYVQKVSHLFSGDGYTQSFSLKRNALGAAGSNPCQESRAIP